MEFLLGIGLVIAGAGGLWYGYNTDYVLTQTNYFQVAVAILGGLWLAKDDLRVMFAKKDSGSDSQAPPIPSPIPQPVPVPVPDEDGDCCDTTDIYHDFNDFSAFAYLKDRIQEMECEEAGKMLIELQTLFFSHGLKNEGE